MKNNPADGGWVKWWTGELGHAAWVEPACIVGPIQEALNKSSTMTDAHLCHWANKYRALSAKHEQLMQEPNHANNRAARSQSNLPARLLPSQQGGREEKNG